jgi:tight adherence protein C
MPEWLFSLEQLYDPGFAVSALAAIAAVAAIITVAMPLLADDRLGTRMRYVAKERDKIRARERARLHETGKTAKAALRSTPKAFMQQVVDRFNLQKLLEAADTRDKLKMAGLRGQPALITFLFARVAVPPITFLVVLGYLFLFDAYADQPALLRLLIAFGAGYAGFYLPNVYVTNRIKRRQQEIMRAFPDALDLLLICLESGMSVEQAFRKVSQEIGTQSVGLAEELSLTTAELSYLQERRAAYENLGKRIGLPGVKGVVTALIQAERYGTPLGQAMRVMAQENRDMRMAEAEKKAAALPPKLTVPMILFFLPVLFIVILGPAVIKLMQL